MPQPRIRMFAGPNGSGKSTVKEYLLPHHIGAYLNADELEQNLKHSHQLDLMAYHPALKAQELIDFLKQKKTPECWSVGCFAKKRACFIRKWKHSV